MMEEALVWPPRSNAKYDRFGGGVWGGFAPPAKNRGVWGAAPPAKIFRKSDVFFFSGTFLTVPYFSA